MPTAETAFEFRANDRDTVAALLLAPPRPHAALVLAHGAGAGMQHAFIQSLARGLGERGIATLRFQFPYMQKGLKRPDPPEVAEAAVRAAVAEAARRLPGVPLFAGGKSFGGRMTSRAQADTPLAGVLGLVFVGFPLHPDGKPSTQRADHLARVRVPMLFLQGSRDALADLELLRGVLATLGDRATLRTFVDADHAFHVRKSSGTSDEEVLRTMIDGACEWMVDLVSPPQHAALVQP